MSFLQPQGLEDPPPAWAAEVVSKEYGQKGDRPWWKKKRYIISLAFLALIVVGAMLTPSDDDDPDVAATSDTTTSEVMEEENEDGNVNVETTAVPPSSTTVASTTTVAPVGGTKQSPYALESPTVIRWDVFGDADESLWEFEVSNIRNATTEIVQANDFNDDPPDGLVFVAANVKATLVEAQKEPLSFGFNGEFEFISDTTVYDWGFYSDLEVFDCGFAVPGEFDEGQEVFAGGTIEGTVCLPAPEEEFDQLALVVHVGSDRFFFRDMDTSVLTEDQVADVTPNSPPNEAELIAVSTYNDRDILSLTVSDLLDSYSSRCTITERELAESIIEVRAIMEGVFGRDEIYLKVRSIEYSADGLEADVTRDWTAADGVVVDAGDSTIDATHYVIDDDGSWKYFNDDCLTGSS